MDNKRYVVLGLSVLFALALAVPALGGPSNPIADVSFNAKKKFKQVNKKAKKANQNAKAAQQSADNAQSSADNAQTTADGAQTAAETAQAAADAAQATADSKFGRVRLFSNSTASNPNDNKSITAACPTGSTNTGGGFIVGDVGADDVTVTNSSSVILYTNGWHAAATENDATADPWSLTASVRCID